MTEFDNNNIDEKNDVLDESALEEQVSDANEPSVQDSENAQQPAYEAYEQEAPQTQQSFDGQPYREPLQQTPPPYQQNNGYYQQNSPYYNQYQQPYRQQGQQMNRQNPQGYAQQPSQGYYRPDTNEYVYSPAPQKKKGGFGKAAIITLVCLLSAFVVCTAAASFLRFVKDVARSEKYDDSYYNSSIFGQRNDDGNDKHNDSSADKSDKNELNGVPADDPEDIGSESTVPVVSEPDEIRTFPTIEQLATPEGAMPLPDIYDKLSRSVVGISCPVQGGTQTGTGFIISEDGYIVTNAHVIDKAKSIMIVNDELKEYEAEVIGSDARTDIAVLRINPEEIDLVPVEFGKSGELRIGELTVAIGNPLGFDLYGTMTTGIVSGLNRSVTISDNTMNLLQTSASINHGNSGGPLINAYGQVIGITSAKIDSTYGEGLGFAIPIDEAVPIIENLIRYGYVPGRPSLGITGQDITDMMSLFYNMPKGVYVFFVTEGSGAEKAGIIPGDLIIGIEGKTIKNMEELNAVKNDYAVGDTVTLTIYRKGQNFDVDVVLTETHPEN